MSVIIPPNFCPNAFTWTLEQRQAVSRSAFGSQAIETAVPQIAISLTHAPSRRVEAIAFQTFIESLKGFQNQVAMHNYAQPVPQGTMRGTMTLDDPAADGDLTLVITAGAGQAGRTLLTGDLVGLGTVTSQQVRRIAADAVADGAGVITVTLLEPLRGAFAAGAAVTWNKPKALFRQRDLATGLQFTPGRLAQGWSLDLIEDWRP